MSIDELGLEAGRDLVRTSQSLERPSLETLTRNRRKRAGIETAFVFTIAALLVVTISFVSPPADDAVSGTTSPPPATTTLPPDTTVPIEPDAPIFVPPTYTEDGRTVLPLTFPDGSRVELVYPSSVDLTSHGAVPYSSGGIVQIARDFDVYYGTADETLARFTIEKLGEYPDAEGEPVGFYHLEEYGWEVNHLVFEFDGWTVLVYDYSTRFDGGVATMTDEARATWARSFHGRADENGFLILSADSPLRLAEAGEHAGPSLFVGGAENGLNLWVGPCEPYEDPQENPDTGFITWCDPEAQMTVHVQGGAGFSALIRDELEIRQLPATPQPSLPLSVNIPESGPIFGEETGVVLLFDDGIDGLTAFDPDRRLVARSTVEGQRAGDEPYSMIRVGDSLVVGWFEPHAIDIATREATPLGEATIFLPAAEPDRVWLIDYPGGRIGGGPPLVWQVDMSGNALTEPVIKTPGSGHPAIGIPRGLALQADAGLSLWYADTGQIVALDAGGAGFVLDVFGDQLAWCSGDCSQLRITDTATLTTRLFAAPPGYDRFLVSGQFSPNGRHLAVLVGGPDVPVEGQAVWILDLEEDGIAVVGDPGSYADFVAWSPAGTQVFATSSSYGERVTVVWRYQLGDRELNAVVLPFGGAISPVVVDADVADAYFSDDLVDWTECIGPLTQPSRRSGFCTFGL